MKLLYALALSLSVACVGIAAAAPARDALKGFNGVDFGTTYDEAKVLLGAAVREVVDPAQPANKGLQGHVRYFGETLDVQYAFKNEGRFSGMAALVVLPDDAAVCKLRWSGIVAQMKETYGEPDTEKDGDVIIQRISFNFADGAIVKAQRMGCGVIIQFQSPPASK